MKTRSYQRDRKDSSAGLALIWMVMIAFGAVTVLGAGSAARKKQKQEAVFEQKETQRAPTPTQRQAPHAAEPEKTDQEGRDKDASTFRLPKGVEDILNRIRPQPPIPQTGQDKPSYPPEVYQQKPDPMANPFSPETQQYCTATPGDPSCGIVADIYGDQLQQMYGNVFGQPEQPQQYLNPMANPKFNPMADPRFNPMADPKFNPMADPKFNPMADPKFNPMYVPGQYTPWSPPGSQPGIPPGFPGQPGIPNIPGVPKIPGIPGAGGQPGSGQPGGGFGLPGGGGFGGWGR